jgi:nucleoid-associated protein YgaU
MAAATLTLGLLTTLPSALDLLDLAGATEGPEDDAELVGAERHVVRPGDTIWDIAAEHLPEGTSVQDYVAEIILLNDIDPAELSPGSVLDLPPRGEE